MKSVIILVLLQLTCLLYVTASNQQKSRLTTSEKLIKTNDIIHANDHYPLMVKDNDEEAGEDRLSPVILLPGDGGSRLEARLDRRDVAHHYCERKTNDWFDLWLNLSLLVPFALDC